MLGLVSDHAVFFPIEYGLCIEFWNTGALGVSFSAAFMSLMLIMAFIE